MLPIIPQCCHTNLTELKDFSKRSRIFFWKTVLMHFDLQASEWSKKKIQITHLMKIFNPKLQFYSSLYQMIFLSQISPPSTLPPVGRGRPEEGAALSGHSGFTGGLSHPRLEGPEDSEREDGTQRSKFGNGLLRPAQLCCHGAWASQVCRRYTVTHTADETNFDLQSFVCVCH